MAGNTARKFVYFEQITLANLAPAFLSSVRGNKVFYFRVGRFLGKVPLLRTLGLKLFQRVDIHPAQLEGLTFEVNEFAFQAAEELYSQIVEQNGRAMGRWRSSSNTDRVDLYVKKLLAMDALPLGRSYLLIRRLVQGGQSPSDLVVLDTPLNRLLVPVLKRIYPELGIRIKGISRLPWSVFNNTLLAFMSANEYLLRIAGMFWARKVCFSKTPRRFNVSKELLWGIGNGRRGDDFIVDGALISPNDLLLYYRHDSSERMSKPGLLKSSLANARNIGYECVDFDRTSIPLPAVWHVFLPRYMWFPISIFLPTLVKQAVRPSAGLLNSIIMGYLASTAGWEAFLASYAPRLNLSQDDPYVRHISETIALNLHGAQNVGFQWSDDTTFRDVLLAYAGFNVYFGWGGLGEKYWEGNWGIDEVIHVGYLWGHHYESSLLNREESRIPLIGDDQQRRFVIAFFDEKIDERHVTEENLYDFYRVSTNLLESRTDTVVVVKPKKLEGLRDIPSVMDLLATHVDSGRLIIWDQGNMDVQHVMALSDVVVSMWMGVPYLEAICCGKPGFNFAPAKHQSSPIYRQAHGKIVFDDVDRLVSAIDRALDHPEENPWADISDLIDEVDPYRDCKGIDRMRRHIHEMFA